MSVPAHLTADQSKLWSEHEPEFDLTDPTARELLETAVVNLDRAKKASEVIDREGLIVTINAGKTETAHPLMKVERDARTLALKCLKELRAKHPSRVSGDTSMSPRARARRGAHAASPRSEAQEGAS